MAIVDWVLGVDLDTDQVAFGAWSVDGEHSATWEVPFPRKKRDVKVGLAGPHRLNAIRMVVAAHFFNARVETRPSPWMLPVAIAVERPTGAHPSPSLSAVWAAIQMGLEEGCSVPILDVAIGDWKKVSVGHGNASKEQVQAWAARCGQPDIGEHRADALGIARWMLETYKRNGGPR